MHALDWLVTATFTGRVNYRASACSESARQNGISVCSHRLHLKGTPPDVPVGTYDVGDGYYDPTKREVGNLAYKASSFLFYPWPVGPGHHFSCHPANDRKPHILRSVHTTADLFANLTTPKLPASSQRAGVGSVFGNTERSAHHSVSISIVFVVSCTICTHSLILLCANHVVGRDGARFKN